MREQQFQYISTISYDNNTDFPTPLGPNAIARSGSVPTTSYFDCLTVYYIPLIGSVFGVVIICIRCDKFVLLENYIFNLTITSYDILCSTQNDFRRFNKIVKAIDEIMANVVSTIIYIIQTYLLNIKSFLDWTSLYID